MNYIGQFTGEHRFLSNFYPCTLVVKGVVYPSAEHCYQAMKTLNEGERVRIAKLPTAALAKKAGARVPLRQDWHEIKLDVMRHIVFAKFNKEPFRQLLFDTGDAHIEEGNYWGDTYWGVCNGKGSNWLGRILMEKRQQLKEAKCQS